MNEFIHKNSSFKVRLKNDKPILKKNSDDFDDSDFNPSFSSEDSNNNESEVENGLIRKKTKSILKNSTKNSTKKPILNKISSFKEDVDSIKIFNSIKHKSIRFKMDENIYSDKEDYSSNGRKELERTKKIERSLVRSISNKEMITKERLNLAETIKFKNEPDSIIVTDQYGFVKSDKNPNDKKGGKKKEKNPIKKARTSKSCINLLQINARLEKWNYMLNRYEEFSTKKRELLKSRTRKGIPDSLRGYAWQLFAEKQKYYVPKIYNELENKPIKEDLEMTIIKDLDRTFPFLQFFKEKYGNGQRKLYKVLSSYSKYNTSVGYVQGMGFIAAIFLLYMDEESSFFMLHSLMKKYKMEGIFFEEFPELRKKFYILLNLQKKYIRKIYNIFQRDEIIPTMYANTWFISLFAKSLDFHIVLRIFDCFFLEGFKVIYRISLALLKLKENDFVKAEKGNTLPLLVSCLENVDEKELFKVAFGFRISRNYIEKLENEYEKIKNDEKNEFIAQLCW
jgi:hypothetical protein